MTAHAHRAPRGAGRAAAGRRPAGDRSGPADHAPEVLLGLAAVVVVIGGPVARSLTAGHGWVAVGSTLLLVAGVVLALVAAQHLLRSPDGPNPGG